MLGDVATSKSPGVAAGLQVVDFPEARGPKELQYDEEWLAVLRGTHHLLSLAHRAKPLPGASFTSRLLTPSCSVHEWHIEGRGDIIGTIQGLHIMMQLESNNRSLHVLNAPHRQFTAISDCCRHGWRTAWAVDSGPRVCAAAALAAGRRRHPAQLRANSPGLRSRQPSHAAGVLSSMGSTPFSLWFTFLVDTLHSMLVSRQ
jgi:Lariat debranching enzyme, C-terminal domain